MRLGLASLILLAALAPVPAFADWMTFVGRNVGTGERTGLGARTSIEGQRPELAIACLSGVLTATFDSGLTEPEGGLDTLPTALSVGADGGAYEAFAATTELHEDREGVQVRLRLGADEALGLSQYVLGAENSIAVSYRDGETELVRFDTTTASAAISLGSVLRECNIATAKSKAP